MFGTSSSDRGSSRSQSMKACNDHFARRQALCDEPTYKELDSEHGGGGAARGERDWTRYAVQDCIHDEEYLNTPLRDAEPPSYKQRGAPSTVTRYTLDDDDPFNDHTVTMQDPRNLQRERTRLDRHSMDLEAIVQRRKIELMSEVYDTDGYDDASFHATDEEGLSNRGSLGALGPVDLDYTYSNARSCRDERQKESIAQFKASAASALKRGSYANNGML